MKTNYYFLLIVSVLIFTTSCKKEKLAPFTPKNHLENFQTEKSQIFDLDTLEFKEIIGKNGTKIKFHRDLFEIEDGKKIQLELIELYDFKEVLYRNIQTVTTDNKLLESSGVLKVTFTSNEKELKLREGELLRVYPPKGKLKDNDVFLSQTDSLGNINWNITNQNYSLFSVGVGGGIWKRILVDNDSIPKLKKQNLISTGYETYEDDLIRDTAVIKEFFILQINTSQWINIDRFVNTENKITFDLEDKSEEFSVFNVYINYEEINSFIYETRLMDELDLSNIPLSGKTFITVIGENKEGVFYDKIELKETINNSKIQLNMKKTTEEELRKMFE